MKVLLKFITVPTATVLQHIRGAHKNILRYCSKIQITAEDIIIGMLITHQPSPSSNNCHHKNSMVLYLEEVKTSPEKANIETLLFKPA